MPYSSRAPVWVSVDELAMGFLVLRPRGWRGDNGDRRFLGERETSKRLVAFDLEPATPVAVSKQWPGSA